jgi:hypothetical protein
MVKFSQEVKRMKKMIGIIVVLMLVSGCTSGAKTTKFTFESGNEGFEHIYADYHDDGNNLTTYEMLWGKEKPTIENATTALFIQGMNRSDDLFMGYVKKLTGLKSMTEYTFKITFVIGTVAEAGSIGVGGSPAESVYVKAGIVDKQPAIAMDDQGVYRLNVDIGNQSQGSDKVKVVSTMAKPEGSKEGYVYKEMEVEVDAKADASGTVYLLIGTDSAFEGLTKYYLDNVTVLYNEK